MAPNAPAGPKGVSESASASTSMEAFLSINSSLWMESEEEVLPGDEVLIPEKSRIREVSKWIVN